MLRHFVSWSWVATARTRGHTLQPMKRESGLSSWEAGTKFNEAFCCVQGYCRSSQVGYVGQVE